MGVRLNATVFEGNDEKMDIAITNEDTNTATDLTGSTIDVYIKANADTADNAVGVIKLSTATSGVTITNAVGGQARITFPNTLSVGTLWWRVDVTLNGLKKTACFGSLYVVNT